MHSFYQRGNLVITWASSVLGAMLMLAAVADYRLPFDADVSLKVSNVNLVAPSKMYWTRGEDMVDLEMDLEIDLSTCMTWNTKQVYLFVYAEYATDRNWLNQVVLWDKIVEHRKIKTGKASLKVTRPVLRQKMPFVDQGNNLRGRSLDIVVAYNIMPHAGMLRTFTKRIEKAVTLPSDYMKREGVSKLGHYWKIDKQP